MLRTKVHQAISKVRIYVNDQQVEHSLRNQFTDFPEIENGQWVRVTDYTVVKGIGQKLQNALLKSGFRTWAQIADAKDLDSVHGIGQNKAAALKAHAQTVDPKGTWKTRWGYLPVTKDPMKLYAEWLDNQLARQYGTVCEQLETLADLDVPNVDVLIMSPGNEANLIVDAVMWIEKNRPVVEAPKPVSKPVTLGQWDHLGYDEAPKTRTLDTNRVVRLGVYANWNVRLVGWMTGYIVDTDAVITAWVPGQGLVKLGRLGQGWLWYEKDGEYRRGRSGWFHPDKEWDSQLLSYNDASITEMFVAKPVDTDIAESWLWEHGQVIEEFMGEHFREETVAVNERPYYRSVERWDDQGFNEIEGSRRTYRDMKFIADADDEWYESPEAYTAETIAEMTDHLVSEFDGIQTTWTMNTRRDWAGESIIARPVFKKIPVVSGGQYHRHDPESGDKVEWLFVMKHMDPRANNPQRQWHKTTVAEYKYHQRMTRTIFKAAPRWN